MTSYALPERDKQVLESAVSAFQDLGIRVGMRMILKLIEAGATLPQIKTMCEDYLK